VVNDAKMTAHGLRGADVAAQAGGKLHSHSFDIISLLLKERSGNGAVNPAAHGYENTFPHRKTL
jgi:hypothetical protein